MTSRTQLALATLGNLRRDPFNPRLISEDELEALTRSIREFGLVDPIILAEGVSGEC